MDNSRWLFIVNPVASGTRLKLAWEHIATKLVSLGLQFDISLTEKRGHATILVQEAIQKGYRNIIGVGGDGTNNEIINGIFSQKHISPLELRYTLLPFGTGNDWSRTHKIPRKVEAWLEMLQASKTIRHSVGKMLVNNNNEIQTRYFINIAGFAYDAHIVKTSEKYPNKSRRKLLYLWLVFKCLFNFSSPKLIIKYNGQEKRGKYYTVNCGVCKYSGGGMMLLPQAQPTSDFLALTLIRDFSKWLVPFASPKLFSGKIASFKYSEVTTSKNIKLEAAGDQELEIEVDGEYLGTGAVEISVIPSALNVIVP